MLPSSSKRPPSKTSSSKADKLRRMSQRLMSRSMEPLAVQGRQEGRSSGASELVVSSGICPKFGLSAHCYSSYHHHHRCCGCDCCFAVEKVELYSFIFHWRVDFDSETIILLRLHPHQRRRPRVPQQRSKCSVTESWIPSNLDMFLNYLCYPWVHCSGTLFCNWPSASQISVLASCRKPICPSLWCKSVLTAQCTFAFFPYRAAFKRVLMDSQNKHSRPRLRRTRIK